MENKISLTKEEFLKRFEKRPPQSTSPNWTCIKPLPSGVKPGIFPSMRTLPTTLPIISLCVSQRRSMPFSLNKPIIHPDFIILTAFMQNYL